MITRNDFPKILAIAQDPNNPAAQEAELLLGTAEGASDVLSGLPSLLNSVVVYQMSRAG